jgi:uncharacterized protein (TIGR03435 family)
VEAKAAGDPRGPEIHRMIQALLADRFQLKLRRETRELPVYWLVVGKNGPRIQRRPGASLFTAVQEQLSHSVLSTALGHLTPHGQSESHA